MAHAVLLMALSIGLQPPATPPRRVVPGDAPETRTIYRELKEGEQRVDGWLRRIECPPGRPVTFTLQVKDKPARYSAPTLASVDYIAHTPTFRGPVTCGGRTPPEHIYLTWKTVGGVARVVAVEFLPK